MPWCFEPIFAPWVPFLTRSPLVGSYVDHKIGIEVYTGNRYFALTGSLIDGHEALPAEPQELGWFVEEVFKRRGDVAGQDIGLTVVKPPLQGWSLERVRDELLPHISSEHYEPWLSVGMALHHQGAGEKKWLELWDRWSQGQPTYHPGACAQKWKGFHTEKPGLRGIVTLATLIKKVERVTMSDGFQTLGPDEEVVLKTESKLLLDPKNFMDIARSFLTQHFQAEEGISLIRSNGLWYEHTGPHYEERDQETLRAALWKFLDQATKRDSNGIVPFNPSMQQITAVLDALRGLIHIKGVPPPTWLPGSSMDLMYSPMDLVVLSNGLLYLTTRTLIPHSSEFFTVNSLPYAYDPNRTPTNWLKFLDQLWPGDLESQTTLQEIFGYLLTSDTSQQKIFLIVGPKRSGKGTIGRVLRELVGRENYVAPTLSSLAGNFGLQPLIGKLVAVIPDARLSAHSNVLQAGVERLLMVSGEDGITVDRKNKDAWTGTLTTRFVILSNEVPQLADASGALHSRFITLALQESFLGREDLGLTPRLLEELPAIFNWALDGWVRLHDRGHFIEPRSGSHIAEELRELSSPISTFLQDKCEVGF